MATSGNDILLFAIVGGTQTAIGSQRGLADDRTRNMIDASDKNEDDAKWLPGRRSNTMTLDALVVAGDAGQEALRDAFDNKSLIAIQIRDLGVAIESANAFVASMSRNAPDNDVYTWTIGLNIEGAWTVL